MARMTTAGAAAAILLMSLARPVAADPADRWRPYVAEAARRFALPPDWIERVIRAESGGLAGLSDVPIRSRVGAMGLMQLMPATWAAMRDRYGLGGNPDDPRDNILAGTAFLRRIYDRFGYPGLFAAYDAGPARYAAWLRGTARLPAETIAYVAKVAAQARNASQWAVIAARSSRHSALFVSTREGNDSASAAAATVPSAGPQGALFAIRKRRE